MLGLGSYEILADGSLGLDPNEAGVRYLLTVALDWILKAGISNKILADDGLGFDSHGAGRMGWILADSGLGLDPYEAFIRR